MPKNNKNPFALTENDEQMMRRQSDLRPEADDEELMAAGMDAAGPQETAQMTASPEEYVPAGGAINGFMALSEVIKKEDIRRAGQILLKYKQGKENLERRIIENEQWYKMRHWGELPDKKNEVQHASAWLFNCIANKHADAMDNFPQPTILPREESDVAEAKMLTSVLPVVLEQNEFEKTYDDVWWYKLKSGTGVYGVFWDAEKLNGLGDITISKVDLLNLFWEPGITDIQKSPHLFCVELADNETLLAEYPQLAGHLSTPTVDVAHYVYDDTVDTTEKSVVIDWYYKKRVNGRTVLHYCKYVNDVVLYASENVEALRERGWYDHGKYPFVFDPLYRVEGTPAGFGFVDVGKSVQTYIDRLDKTILENAAANTRPRHFIRKDGSVNEEEYADLTKDFIHVEGTQLGQDSIRAVEGKPLQGVYYNVLQGKIEEIKETTGTRDVSTGGTTSGVTAGSAIAAMQEASGKLSRDASKASYRAFREIVLMVIELIRQFYDMPRTFRILGEQGAAEYVMFSNAGMQAQPIDSPFFDPAMEQMMRLPLFDVQVSAQKATPYSKMAQNELALSFLNAGLFNPAMADQALICLEMMDFDRKDALMQKIAQQGMMYRQAMMAMAAPPAAGGGNAAPPDSFAGRTDAFGGALKEENALNRRARAEAAERTAPR